jgi:hypothetical protein
MGEVLEKVIKKENEDAIKTMIRIGRKTQISGHDFDRSNMATFMNFLNCKGLITDFEKKDIYEKLNKKKKPI